MNRCRFSARTRADGHLELRDLGGDDCPTITNDADDLVPRLVRVFAIAPTTRIFYRDSADNYAELLRRGDRFLGFAPARPIDAPPTSGPFDGLTAAEERYVDDRHDRAAADMDRAWLDSHYGRA